MSVDIESDPIKPTKCGFYESSIIVIRRKRNADFWATIGSTFSVRIVSKSFKILLFEAHVSMAEMLINSSILSATMMDSQVWSVLI